jgi:putative SOS response-associated peptidase YedK
MPVILPTSSLDFWLDPAVEDHTRLLDVLRPFPAAEMDAYTVSDGVNSVKNDSPECIEPVTVLGQQSLF